MARGGARDDLEPRLPGSSCHRAPRRRRTLCDDHERGERGHDDHGREDDGREDDDAASTNGPIAGSTVTATPRLRSLEGSWLESLEDDVGVVAVPLGATTKRPVVVSLHGAESAAEWACGDWMGPTNGYPFIVCPRTRTERKGRPASWSSVDEATSRSREALARVRSRYGDWMSDADPVYVGFSQGAEMVVAAADHGAMTWSALFVHEGGYRQQRHALARLLAGPRPVFATCSTRGCSAHFPKKLGPRSRTNDYGPHGHSMGPVVERLRADFADMVQDRDEWSGLPTR